MIWVAVMLLNALLILYSTWQVGDGRHWAWLLLVVTNIPYAAFSVIERQPAFLLTSLLFGVVQWRNYRKSPVTPWVR